MILIVEDHDDSRLFLQRLLKKKGYAADAAATASEAWALAHQHVPQLFILDEQMPDMTGCELLSRLRGDSLFSGSRAFFLSGCYEPGVIRRGLSLGASEWLIKGVHGPDYILAAVERALLA